ncbi:hypothetical protein DTO271D3_7426 [Paecilomyces variotii]|nr:hypothetical protein DTO212C5_8 [Paecilomyces variotii]KAJ9304909.1 hypothetical protein DTO217A2_5562 [Paecilomyces variotii]KAJ9312268.1 hypothetical protein DTO271D3_7426 [Paecilomyces variotii]KAJ9328335.1 hypothetical protein DTO027B3_1372 [Paecilomyces variotii]KAJ9336515.1 hypothetical protein DTO027B5_1830 [Paecilomyces variotii]
MPQEHSGQTSMSDSLPDAQPAAAPTKQTYKSFKKKYAKLKVQFELGMRESEALFREQMRIQDLSNRIQEQNDQLLEVLLEFNESLHVPTHLRYDLNVPGESPALNPVDQEAQPPPSYDVATAKATLDEARSELASGEITPDTYRRLEEAVKRSKAFEPSNKYPSLLQVPHTTTEQFPHELDGDNLGYLTPEHEAEYFLMMDARLGDAQAAEQLSRAPEKPSLAEREREAALRNPVSVYNWLRRNQPQVFLQDNEITSEKSVSRPANLRTSKRATQPRKEEDVYDEDGILMDVAPAPGSSRGKRKRDDDTGYRPKGGSSGGRGSRKKKDDGSYGGRRTSKRSSGVGA